MSKITEIYSRLCDEVDALKFSPPVLNVYNPLRYAWDGFTQYAHFFRETPRVVFVGMNPGPWGMAQTGVPFGEVDSVKNFLGIHKIAITPPENLSASYPVKGLECPRSEISGKRLWGLFKECYRTADKFFSDCAVLNYCPLLFLADNGKNGVRNFTPDKLKKNERAKLFAYCDAALREVVEELRPEYVAGVGNFAAERAAEALSGMKITITKIFHPSPASPKSNSKWAEKVTEQLKISGAWK